MRKLATSLLVLGLAAPALATAASAQMFYVGAKVGANELVSEQKTTVLQAGGGNSDTSTSRNISMQGVTGGLYLGYGWSFLNNGYLGLEVDGNIRSNGANLETGHYLGNTGSNFNVKETSHYAYGVSIIPGILINGTTKAYLKAGFRQASFRSSSVDGIDLGYTGNFEKWLVGAQFGVGIETQVYKHLSVRLEYDYTTFKGFSMTSASPAAANDVTTNYQPHSNQVEVGVTYYLPV